MVSETVRTDHPSSDVEAGLPGPLSGVRKRDVGFLQCLEPLYCASVKTSDHPLLQQSGLDFAFPFTLVDDSVAGQLANVAVSVCPLFYKYFEV